MTTQSKNLYHYKSCGLDNIYLVNGFSVEQDPIYGEFWTFEDIEGLHALIGHNLVNHEHELNGKEFRFLRKEMEISQKELARLIKCDEQTIGRWERGESDIPGAADRLVRLMYQEYYSQNPHIIGLLERIAELVQEEEQMVLSSSNLHFTRDANEWKLAA